MCDLKLIISCEEREGEANCIIDCNGCERRGRERKEGGRREEGGRKEGREASFVV